MYFVLGSFRELLRTYPLGLATSPLQRSVYASSLVASPTIWLRNASTLTEIDRPLASPRKQYTCDFSPSLRRLSVVPALPVPKHPVELPACEQTLNSNTAKSSDVSAGPQCLARKFGSLLRV
ncbi:hypothetical protein HGRIS_014551 [Hohenbuehelia grisea]|uniref:Uncharacterized protein n=1 Tax=Hohenbuehelia grisea TaxID=104357 RepID=A0ABR3JTW9_9AGAR